MQIKDLIDDSCLERCWELAQKADQVTNKMKYYKMKTTLTTTCYVEPVTFWTYSMIDDFFTIPSGGIEITEEEYLEQVCDDTEEI